MRKKTAKLKNRIRAIKLNQTALDEILFGTLMNESLRLFDLTEKKMDGFCFRMLMNESRTEAIFYVCDDSLASNGLDFSKTDQFVRESTSLETTESIYEYCPNKTVYTEIAAETQEDGN